MREALSELGFTIKPDETAEGCYTLSTWSRLSGGMIYGNAFYRALSWAELTDLMSAISEDERPGQQTGPGATTALW